MLAEPPVLELVSEWVRLFPPGFLFSAGKFRQQCVQDGAFLGEKKYHTDIREDRFHEEISTVIHLCVILVFCSCIGIYPLVSVSSSVCVCFRPFLCVCVFLCGYFRQSAFGCSPWSICFIINTNCIGIKIPPRSYSYHWCLLARARLEPKASIRKCKPQFSPFSRCVHQMRQKFHFFPECLDFSFSRQEQTRDWVQYNVLQTFTYMYIVRNVYSVGFPLSMLCPEFSKYRFNAYNCLSLRM